MRDRGHRSQRRPRAGVEREVDADHPFRILKEDTLVLRHLENRGILTRYVFAEVPPRVAYHFTGRGRSLESILLAMWMLGSDESH